MQERLSISTSIWVVIIPGQPSFRVLGKISGMFLKYGKVIKWINPSQIAGMDQAHKQIPNARTIFSFIKQCIFPMQDGFFQSPFADIVYGCRAMHPMRTVIQNTSQ